MTGDISKSDKSGNPVKNMTILKKKLSKHIACTVRRVQSLPLKKFKINNPVE